MMTKNSLQRGLVEKYQDELKELCKYDNDTKDVFGFVNTWWVFGEVAKEMNYKIFMAEVENIGYKRTKRGEKPMPNDLFDLEIAPSSFDFINFSQKIDEYIEESKLEIEKLEKDKKELKTINIKSSGSSKKTKVKTSSTNNESKIKEIDFKIEELKSLKKYRENEKKEIITDLKTIYNTKWELKNLDRVDQNTLKNIFSNYHLKDFISNNILIRTKTELTALDFMRTIKWD